MTQLKQNVPILHDQRFRLAGQLLDAFSYVLESLGRLNLSYLWCGLGGVVVIFWFGSVGLSGLIPPSSGISC